MPQLDMYIWSINIGIFFFFIFLFHYIILYFFLIRLARGIFLRYFFFRFFKFLPKYLSVYDNILTIKFFEKFLNCLNFRYMLLKKFINIYICYNVYRKILYMEYFVKQEEKLLHIYIRYIDFFFVKNYFINKK